MTEFSLRDDRGEAAHDKRYSVRLRSFIEVTVEDPVSSMLFRGAIADISLHGMRLIVEQYLSKGTRYTFTMKRAPFLKLRGEVRWIRGTSDGTHYQIGVQYVGLTPDVVAASLALRDAAVAEDLPLLRIGLSAGPVISRDGDYFGPVVNLASRLTELAEPGEVLAPIGLRDELTAGPGAAVRAVSRGTHDVRSIGPTEVFALERSR